MIRPLHQLTFPTYLTKTYCSSNIQAFRPSPCMKRVTAMATIAIIIKMENSQSKKRSTALDILIQFSRFILSTIFSFLFSCCHIISVFIEPSLLQSVASLNVFWLAIDYELDIANQLQFSIFQIANQHKLLIIL